MKWTNEITLEFLRLYEEESVIWNPSDANHKNRNAVNDAWCRIQETFYSQDIECSITELKKKKEALMATFRPILQKVKNSENSGSDLYKPNWFAYEAMYKFLRGIYQPRITSTIKSEEIECVDEEYETEEIEEDTDDIPPATQNPGTSFKPVTRSMPLKRKISELQEVEKHVEDAYSIMTSVCEKPEKDECSIFTELLAIKLRKFDENTRAVVMHDIDNLIFEARMQCFNPAPDQIQANIK